MPTPYRHTIFSKPVFGPLLLYVLLLPLLPAIFISLAKGQLVYFIVSLVSFCLLVAGALCVRYGMLAATKPNRTKWSSSGRFRWKTLAGVLTGSAVGLCANLIVGHTWPIALCFSLAAFVGVRLSYGPDPRPDPALLKKSNSISKYGLSAAEISRTMAQAEAKIIAIEEANRDIRNPELNGRLERITHKAHSILDTIAADPRDIRRARKFLKVYLDGAQSVTEGYVRTNSQQQNQVLQDNFRNVLVTIEDVFTQQHERLLENNVMDLDVQIEVLTTQLEREGVI